MRRKRSIPAGLSNNVFVSRYVLYMPDKEQLITQVEAVLDKWKSLEDGGYINGTI